MILPTIKTLFERHCSPSGVSWIAMIILSAASLSNANSQEKSTAPRPNVILILTDDHGVGDVSAFGSKDIHTPNIDRIGAEGIRFTGMRSNCTVCSPSRAAILTGRYPDRVGVPGVIRTQAEDSWGYFNPRIPTLADELRGLGYHTGCIGKWHLGLDSPNTPNERGFDHFHGFLGDMMDSYTTHLRHGRNYMRLNREVIEPVGHATDLFTTWAEDYLKERAAEPRRPFFLYLAYNAPHFPIEPPREVVDRVRARGEIADEKRLLNAALVEHLDDGVGRVLKTLAEQGLEQNTLVIFTSDNGGSLPHGQRNDPWRDGKQSHYDGGLRVPFMMRWPAFNKAGLTCDYQGLNFDIFPTVIELAGGRPPADIDAFSLSRAMRGEKPVEDRELYFVRREGGAAYGGRCYEAIIRGDWKLMQNDPYHPLELYNLRTDPFERENVIDKNKKVADDLSARMRRHIQRGGRVPWQPPSSISESKASSTER